MVYLDGELGDGQEAMLTGLTVEVFPSLVPLLSAKSNTLLIPRAHQINIPFMRSRNGSQAKCANKQDQLINSTIQDEKTRLTFPVGT